MSRCFPYPPPGFIGKKACDVPTLIDSIKLQKETKEKKKDKRRDKGEKKEKKEKKRDKKEKKQSVCSKQTEVNKDAKNWIEPEGFLSQKRKREDTEQLEGSSVTEEHGQPLNLQNPSYSSDGTQNSNKRRKQASVASDKGHGNIIRIKLPVQKQNETESKVSKEQLYSTSARNVQNREPEVKASKEQLCSTSGRNEMYDEQIRPGSGLTDLFVHREKDVSRTSEGVASLTLLRRDNSLQGFPCPSNDLHCTTSGNVEDLAQVGSCSTSGDKKMQKKVAKYNNLIQSLYQITVPTEVVDKDDEDWLFGGKSSDTVVKKRNVEKQLSVNSGVTCSASSALYPRAQYLEEAKIYALPYTVPF